MTARERKIIEAFAALDDDILRSWYSYESGKFATPNRIKKIMRMLEIDTNCVPRSRFVKARREELKEWGWLPEEALSPPQKAA